ncbi:MAG: Hsp20/alpha crystallin family protein [Deltaproteobacteria bacterium]|nr:Hsp20/alpha crystallin family protein [Deltaproteobacteria bacterium]
MQLVKFSPVRDMFSFRNRINHMFDDGFYPINRDEVELSMGSWNPVVDVYDNDDSIVIKAELPGIDKEGIEIDVKDRVLTLKGERSSESEVKDDNYYRRERSFGKFERAFNLPADVEPDKIKADYKDGVLKIDIPKPEEKKPRQITIH